MKKNVHLIQILVHFLVGFTLIEFCWYYHKDDLHNLSLFLSLPVSVSWSNELLLFLLYRRVLVYLIPVWYFLYSLWNQLHQY